jgi:aldehyde:ferredoxin oxidoreductase
MVADFNAAMGWDKEGYPTQEKLVELGLEEWGPETG